MRTPTRGGKGDDPPLDSPKGKSKLQVPLATGESTPERRGWFKGGSKSSKSKDSTEKTPSPQGSSPGGDPKDPADSPRPPLPPPHHELGDGTDEDFVMPPQNDDEEWLPRATAVSPQEHVEPPAVDHSQKEPIAVATKFKWLDWSNKRVRLCVLLVILLVCGVVGGVVAAVMTTSSSSSSSASNNSDTSMPTPAPDDASSPVPTSSVPTTMGPTPTPTSLVLEQLGQAIVELPADDARTGLRGESFFGWVVDLSSDGTRLAATSPYCQCVFIYDLVENAWVQSAKITDDTGVIDHMALSGDGQVLVIGVPRNSQQVEIGGKVLVFQNTGQGTWVEMGNAIFGESSMDRIGGFLDDDEYRHLYADDDDVFLSRDTYDSSSLALSENGSVLAIGSATGNYVLVFSFDADTMQWTRLGKNHLIGEEPGDKFGAAVDLSGNGTRIVIGAPSNLGTSNRGDLIYSGHVRVFQYVQDEDRWVKLGQDLDGQAVSEISEGFEAEQAGSSVSISSDGSTIAVGANKKAESEDVFRLGDNDGTTTVYKYSESRDEWTQVGNTINAFQYGQSELEGIGIFLFGDLNFEKFPLVARLSGNGKRVVVSVLAESLDGAVTARGVVRLYELRGERWVVVGEPIQGTEPYDFSGRSIAISQNGTTLAIGSPQHNNAGVDDGQVRVFSVVGTTSSPPTMAPTSAAPTMAPPPAGPPVPILIQLDLQGNNRDFGWEVTCGANEIESNPPGTYEGDEFTDATIVDTVMVPDGSTCLLNFTGEFDCCGNEEPYEYRVYYVDEATDEDNIIVEGILFQTADQEQVAFHVAQETASLSFFLQLDANSKETSWSLTCDGVPYASEGLGEHNFGENFLVNRTLLGVREGAVCEFVIQDYFGDGICCGFDGNGFYKIYYGIVPTSDESDNLLAAGGDFASEERVSFVVSPNEDPVTPAPSVATSLAPTSTPLNPLVNIEVKIVLDDFPFATGWQLMCNDRLLALVPRGSYSVEFDEVTQVFAVEEGATCRFDVGEFYEDGRFELLFSEQGDEDNSAPIAQGSDFGEIRRITFVATRPPVTPSPSQAPTPPTATPVPSTAPPTITAAPTGSVPITVLLLLDRDPQDTGWSLECNERLLANVPSNTYQSVYELVSEPFFVQDGALCNFTITDETGNGICCTPDNGERGFYQIFLGEDVSEDGVKLAQGGKFEFQEQVVFTVSPESAINRF